MGDFFDSTHMIDIEDFWVDRFKEERQAARADVPRARKLLFACSALGAALTMALALFVLVRVA
jgi:hypothetical protein